MISREKYLLTVLAEEANEIAVRASKAIRFGLSEKQPGQDLSNAARIKGEINDLLAVVDMLNSEFDLGFFESSMLQKEKREKVEKYYRYSVELGEVSPAAPTQPDRGGAQ